MLDDAARPQGRAVGPIVARPDRAPPVGPARSRWRARRWARRRLARRRQARRPRLHPPRPAPSPRPDLRRAAPRARMWRRRSADGSARAADSTTWSAGRLGAARHGGLERGSGSATATAASASAGWAAAAGSIASSISPTVFVELASGRRRPCERRSAATRRSRKITDCPVRSSRPITTKRRRRQELERPVQLEADRDQHDEEAEDDHLEPEAAQARTALGVQLLAPVVGTSRPRLRRRHRAPRSRGRRIGRGRVRLRIGHWRVLLRIGRGRVRDLVRHWGPRGMPARGLGWSAPRYAEHPVPVAPGRALHVRLRSVRRARLRRPRASCR